MGMCVVGTDAALVTAPLPGRAGSWEAQPGQSLHESIVQFPGWNFRSQEGVWCQRIFPEISAPFWRLL